MKAALALLLSLSAFSSEERLPSPPSCAEIGEQEKRQKLETTEREQLTRSRPVHQRQSSLKEIQNAIGLHDSALNTFQQLRRQVCERKAVDQEEIYQKAQERLQNASDSNQCSFYRDQKDLDAEASRKLTLYRDKMRDKLKEWKSILDNSILTNRNLIATARNQNEIGRAHV